MTERNKPSLYHDIPALLAQKPFKYGHLQEELDDLNERLAGYMGMDKRSLTDKIQAKPVFMSMLVDFDRATPDSLRSMELLGFIPGHEPGRSELEEMLALNAKTQRDARKADNATKQQGALPLSDAAPDAITESPEALHLRSDRQFDAIRREIQMCREAVQPMRPRIMKDMHVLRGINPDLYVPFARAFAASLEADRAHPEHKHELKRLKNINALGSEVQAFLLMYDYANSIEKFRQKFIRKAEEAHTDVGYYWKAHRAEVMPYLTKITDKYNARLKEMEKVTVTAGKEGFSTLPAYQEWIRAEQAIHDPEFFIRLQLPRDAMRHLAMEFFVGGEEPATGERRHKLLSRIETAYQDDLALVKEAKTTHGEAHIAAIDAHPRTPTTKQFNNPLEANLHTLNRVYEGRWAALADELLEQSRTKLLSDPGIYPDAMTAAERRQAEMAARKAAREAGQEAERAAADADGHTGQVMSKRALAALKRRSERSKGTDNQPGEQSALRWTDSVAEPGETKSKGNKGGGRGSRGGD